jgi:hypothetical protein
VFKGALDGNRELGMLTICKNTNSRIRCRGVTWEDKKAGIKVACRIMKIKFDFFALHGE